MSEAIGSIRTNDGTQSTNLEVKRNTHTKDFGLNVIRELIASGKTLRAIATQLEISHCSVWRFCKKHGIAPNNRYTIAGRVSRDAIIARRDAGDGKSEAAAHFGIGRKNFGRLLRHYDLQGRWPGTDRLLAKTKLTPEQRKRGMVVAAKVRQLSRHERDRYHALKSDGASVLQAFAQIARDRRAQECALPQEQA